MKVSKKILVWVVFLMALLVYLPSLKGRFFLDDEYFFVSNRYVREFDLGKIFTESTYAGAGETSNYYRPLTSLSFALNYALFGIDPVGWKLTNVVLHGLAGVVLFWLLVELLLIPGYTHSAKSRAPRSRDLEVALWVAMIFVTHPVQVEAVAFTNSRGDSLYSLLLFAGLYMYTKSFKAAKRQSYKALLLSMVLYGAAILAKEIAVAGVGLYALILLTKLMQATSDKRQATRLRELVFKFKWQVGVLVANFLTLTTYVYLRLTRLNFTGELKFAFENKVYTENMWVRLMTFGRIFWEYMRILVWPHPLYYGRKVEVLTGVNVWLVAMMGLVVGLGIAGWWERRRLRTVWVWFGLGWFLVMLAPVSGVVVPMNNLLFEHWLYGVLPGFFLMGYGVMGVLMLDRCGEHRNTEKTETLKKMVVMGALGLVGVYGVMSVKQINIWKDPVGFYEYNLQYGKLWGFYHNLCHELQKRERYGEAIEYCEKALVFPEALPHNTLGVIYGKLGDWDKAEGEYLRAVEIDPEFYPAWQNLMGVYVDSERYGEALEVAERLVEIDSEAWQYWLGLGKVQWLMGDEAEAEVSWEGARKLGGEADEVEEIVNRITNNE